MVNTYAVQSGGCRFESLWGFGFSLKGAHYEVDYSGKKTYLAGLQCTLTSIIIGTYISLSFAKVFSGKFLKFVLAVNHPSTCMFS